MTVQTGLLICLLLVILGVSTTALSELDDIRQEGAKHYAVQHAETDTTSRNQVTAVILVYRLFDSLLEVAMLLVCTVALALMLEQPAPTGSRALSKPVACDQQRSDQ